MEMYNNELKTEIHEMFEELQEKVREIITTSKNFEMASERITNTISYRIAAESEAYIVEMYTSLVAKIKDKEYFKDPAHLNAFYRLNLRDDLNEKYHFEVKSLDAYKKGIKFNEVNTLYATASAAAGTLAVGGVLKFAIFGLVHIPFALIIVGAVAVACSTYAKIVPNRNKREFQRVVDKLLLDMENELLDWLGEVEGYFESRVRTLNSTNV